MRLGRLKFKSKRTSRRVMPRFRRARRATRTVYRTARRGVRRARRSGFGRSMGGGGIIRDIEGSLGKGMLYQGVAQKFVPSLAPIAGLYGGWKGGGLTGLAVTELFVKPFIGLPSNLGSIGNIFGSLGLGGQTSTGSSGMGASV